LRGRGMSASAVLMGSKIDKFYPTLTRLDAAGSARSEYI